MPVQTVSKTGKILRGEKGQILPGSAPLNPTGQPEVRQRHQHYLQLMEETITDEEVREIVRRAVADAKDGNRFARDFIFQYLIGKPAVVSGGPPREAPMFRLLQTWLVAELASGKLEISQLTGELSAALPAVVEEED